FHGSRRGPLLAALFPYTTLFRSRGQHRKYLPYVFTEQGVAMLSSVLRSERAVQVNIEIMRAFVKLRHVLGSHVELAKKLSALEEDRKSTRLNSSHDQISYAVFCL